MKYPHREEEAMPRKAASGGAHRARVLSPKETEERRAQLQAELASLEAQDARRLAAIGRAIEKHADNDPAFATELRRILEANVTDRGDRVCLGLDKPRRGGRRRSTAAPEAVSTSAS